MGSNLHVLTAGPFIHEVPSWSPDGTQIVFDYTATDPNLPGFATQLWVMNADGTNARPLMTSALSGFDVEPRSANGWRDHVQSDPIQQSGISRMPSMS